jgi:hypothetical protein
LSYVDEEELLTPPYPNEEAHSTLFIDQAYQEAQKTIEEGNAVLNDVSVSSTAATHDTMMGDESAHRKRRAEDDLAR